MPNPFYPLFIIVFFLGLSLSSIGSIAKAAPGKTLWLRCPDQIEGHNSALICDTLHNLLQETVPRYHIQNRASDATSDTATAITHEDAGSVQFVVSHATSGGLTAHLYWILPSGKPHATAPLTLSISDGPARLTSYKSFLWHLVDISKPIIGLLDQA